MTKTRGQTSDAASYARHTAALADLEGHKVDWRGSFLARDGSAMICWFVAPDAESERVALRQSGADTRILWGGIVHEGPEPADPNVVVARSFAEPVTLQDIQSLEDTGAACLRAHHVKCAPCEHPAAGP